MNRKLVALTMVGVVTVGIVGLSIGTSSRSSAESSTATVYRWGVSLPTGGGVAAGAEANAPTAVTGIPDPVVQIATSNSDSYALTVTGTVWAWGADAVGEFGNGTTMPFSNLPVQVDFPAGVSIASLPSPMPYNTGLAIDTEGNIWGWGFNQENELCLTSSDPRLPAELPLTDVTLASGAGEHMLYYSNGQLYACGDNKEGQLGDGTTTSSSTPVAVLGLPGDPVQALVSSWEDSGALMANGTYFDWGFNASGQLGNGTTAHSTLPVLVSLPTAVTDVSQGGSSGSNGQSLAVLADGSVWAWGQGGFGQLGDGLTSSALSPVPVSVPAGVSFSQVSSGGATSYAIDTTGDLWAWGENNYGQLGDGTSDSGAVALPLSIGVFLAHISSTASNVAGFSPVTAIVTVVGSANPTTTGPVSYDVTVSGSGAMPTGTVVVADGDGGTCAISSLDSSGSGSCSITENAESSPYTLTATYSGDADYLTATGSTSEIVNLAAPAVSVAGSANPGATGPVSYDVTVSGSGAMPTGTVVVADGDGGTCAISSLDSSGSGSCSITENAESSPYAVTATYSGDSNYLTAQGASTEIVNPDTPTVTVTGSPNPATGGSVTYEVTVSGSGATPTGTVSVSDGNGGTCAITALDDLGSGSCSIIENAASSPYTTTATYSGDANYLMATALTTETVNPATPTVTVAGSANPATTGPVTYDVTVSGSGATPTGTVSVSDGDGGTCSISSVDSSGFGSCSLTENAASSPNTVTATYAGDANYLPATGSTTETVSPSTPTVTVIGSANPATTGRVTYDVTVSDSGATPTGTVLVSDGNGGTCAISSLDSSGSGTCKIGANAQDSPYSVTATYDGDRNYTSAIGTLTEVVAPASPTVAIRSSGNPAPLGPVAYNVTVTGFATFTPTGSVTVSDGTRTCTIASLNPAGKGSCKIIEPAGTYAATATYAGNASYSAASRTTSETVNKAAPSVAVSASPRPTTTGRVTFRVVVRGMTGLQRTGSVVVTDGTRRCTIAALNTSGRGSCRIAERIGTYTVTATYSGDANYTSATGTTSETVNNSRSGEPMARTSTSQPCEIRGCNTETMIEGSHAVSDAGRDLMTWQRGSPKWPALPSSSCDAVRRQQLLAPKQRTEFARLVTAWQLL
jgi:large repetitive protein